MTNGMKGEFLALCSTSSFGALATELWIHITHTHTHACTPTHPHTRKNKFSIFLHHLTICWKNW